MPRITSFDFQPGDRISQKYEVLSLLGKGWESEVYLVKEKKLGVKHALKIFFPQRNKKNQVATYHGKKLHKLHDCSVIAKYHTTGEYKTDAYTATYLVSEYIQGEPLSRFLTKQPGKRLHPFQALHLFYTLVLGIEEIHLLGEYHGDLHTENIIVCRQGLSFEIKIVDLFHWKQHSVNTNKKDDIVFLVCIFYELLGGKKYYKKQPEVLKQIICGKRKERILKQFRTVTALRKHLESLEW